MGEITLRASALPLAFRCPGSARPASLRVDPTNEAASVGTAAHEALRSLAETGSLDWEGVRTAAERHLAPVDEVRMLCAIGAKLWPALADSFAGASTEVALSTEIAPGVTLTGHIDLVALRRGVARAGDWKSGRKDTDHSQQMRAYGVLVLDDNPDVQEATITIVWLRDSEAENYTMTRDDAAAWKAELIARVVNWDGVFRPGEHCTYCPRSHECEAATALVRRDVAALTDGELAERAQTELATMAPAEIVDLYRKAKTVSGYAQRVHDAIKAHVAKHGDVTINGARLTIEEEQQRQLDPLTAWPVLEGAGFEPEDLAACIRLSVGKVEKRAAQKAGRGKGAAAVRALGEQLSEAGAVGVRTTRKLTEKRSA